MKTKALLLAMTVLSLQTVSTSRAETARPADVQIAQAAPAPTEKAQPTAPAEKAPSTQPAPAAKLTGMAAWNALVGNTVVGKLEGKDFVDYYLADGSVKSMVESQIVTGKWSLEGDKICFTYPDEPKDCYGLEVAGDAATFTDKSGTGIRGQIMKGNAKNL